MYTKVSLTIFCLVFLIVNLVPTMSLAAQPEFKVAYVDLERALRLTKAGSAAQKSYDTELDEAQKDLDKKKSQFERERDSFIKQRDTLSDEALATRQEKLVELEKDLKRTFSDSQERLRRTNVQLVGSLMKRMRDIVEEVGKKEGFTMILEKSSQSVLYADQSIDITDRVVATFDANNK